MKSLCIHPAIYLPDEPMYMELYLHKGFSFRMFDSILRAPIVREDNTGDSSEPIHANRYWERS